MELYAYCIKEEYTKRIWVENKNLEVTKLPVQLCKIYLRRIGYLQVTNWYLLIDTVLCFFICLPACFAGVFFLFHFAFVLSFALFPNFSFNPQFKVDLN